MNFIISLLDNLNDWLYTYYLVVLLVFVGIFLSFKFGFVKIGMFIESLKAVTEKVDSDVLHPEHISPFQALMISPPVESA